MRRDESFPMVDNRVGCTYLLLQPVPSNHNPALPTLPFVASIRRTGVSLILAIKQYVPGAVALADGYHCAACTASG